MELTTQEQNKQKANVQLVDGKGLAPKDFDGLWRVATVIAASGLAPKDMIGKPENVFVACQMGFEVGLSIMASIQNIAVINGRPSIWGDSVLALVRASGKLESYKESFEGKWPNDDFKAVCIAKRKGDKELIRREFTIADAKTACLWTYPNKGVTPWHKYPKRMLQMRARSWCMRDGFGDVLKGIQIAEEVQDMAYDADMKPDASGLYKAADINQTDMQEPEYAEPGTFSVSAFDQAVKEFLPEWPNQYFDEYLKIIADYQDMTVDQAKVQIIQSDDVQNCAENFFKYLDSK